MLKRLFLVVFGILMQSFPVKRPSTRGLKFKLFLQKEKKKKKKAMVCAGRKCVTDVPNHVTQRLRATEAANADTAD